MTTAARDAFRTRSDKPSVARATVSMDTFKWVVTGLLTALVAGVSWFLADIRTDIRDMRREVTTIRIETTATNTRLEALMEEGRRRSQR